MTGATHFKEPIACTEGERREFARLVRQGFALAADVDARILAAQWLAFYYATGDTLGAVAAIKAPTERHRQDIFTKAHAPVAPADYERELGWVFVLPGHRGNRIAGSLCRQLLARVPESGVFATTRTDNHIMTKILLQLGFTRAGKPFARRDEQLVLFLRGRPTLPAPRSPTGKGRPTL